MADLNRVDRDQQIQELYQQYKASQNKVENSKRRNDRISSLPTIGGLTGRLLTRFLQRDVRYNQEEAERLSSQISELVRERPGSYPLEVLKYAPDFHVGFQYGFKYSIDSDVFEPEYFSYNSWGIDVVKHRQEYSPRIQVYSTLSSKFRNLTCLHLPGGFIIPVGPLHFEEDSLPVDEDEIEKAKLQALSIAKEAGINISPTILEQADGFMEEFGSKRTYPDRYFYWQPVLPDKRARIAIDFSRIKPMNMGLRLEGAPIFTDTTIYS